jgi:hypothetical protein
MLSFNLFAEEHAMLEPGPLDLEALRAHLCAMNDAELLQFGLAARHACTPDKNQGRPPLTTISQQLEAARKEWRQRHPGLPLCDSF